MPALSLCTRITALWKPERKVLATRILTTGCSWITCHFPCSILNSQTFSWLGLILSKNLPVPQCPHPTPTCVRQCPHLHVRAIIFKWARNSAVQCFELLKVLFMCIHIRYTHTLCQGDLYCTRLPMEVAKVGKRVVIWSILLWVSWYQNENLNRILNS